MTHYVINLAGPLAAAAATDVKAVRAAFDIEAHHKAGTLPNKPTPDSFFYPALPAQPTPPTKPAQPAQPAQPTSSAKSAQPASSAKSAQPTKPAHR